MSTPADDLRDAAATDHVVMPPERRPRPRLRATAIVVAALAAAVLAYRLLRPAGSATAPRYVTAPADRGTIDQTVTATGTVNPVTTVQVGTYVSGPIQEIGVTFNSRVKKGQRVARIDPAPFLVKVREAEANLANARARVVKDRADLALKKLLLDRSRPLIKEGIIAQTDFDTAKSNYDQAAAQLALDAAGVGQAAASLDEAQINLRYTDILSPVDGVVVAKNVDVGQTVAASFQTPTLFLIAQDLTKMQVDTNVSESDVGRVREGQPATFTVDAYPGQPFHGTVSQVRNAPITVQNVVTYDVVVAVDNSGLELKPGMTANVSITTAHRDDVLRVPVRALSFRPEGAGPAARTGAPAILVLGTDGALRRVEVRPGARDNQHVELLDGDVHEGDPIVTGVQRETSEQTPAPAPPGFATPRRRF